MNCSVLVLLTMSLAAGPRPKPVGSAASRSLPDGTYHCLIGFRTMLTYGDFTLKGGRFTFKPAGSGAGGAGTYRVNADGSMTWTGDLGVINRPPAELAEAGREPGALASFWFKFRVKHGASAQTMSCRLQ